jgi:methionine sulfoxide reductase catalytic subunit
MLIWPNRIWDFVKPSEITPESVAMDRRRFVTGAAALGGGIAASGTAQAQWFGGSSAPATPEVPDPTADLYPVKRNEKFVLDRALTEEKFAASYNNFYEFGTSKDVTAAARALRTRPWTVKIDGLVEKPLEVGIDDMIRKMPLEERLYRHRCVEAWSMSVPWTGFPLSALIALAKPTSGAKFLRFETFLDPKMASGQKQAAYPWPYVEGLTMEEAMNDLTLMVTGVYGKPLAKQFGAPLRLALPWKYGFKSIKSITRISFVAEQPKGLWEVLQSAEYGFWANVNPAVSHPRWSQATEQVLGTNTRVPTLIWNGYGESVAGMYKGLEKERLFV